MAARRDSRPWLPEEDAFLTRLYPLRRAVEIADVLGRTLAAVENRRTKLGLRKGTNAGRFQPGQTSWNKGKHHTAGGRSAETRFKPGNRPHTWRPIGANRVSKEGYLQRKVADTGCTRRDYVPVHHLVWRMHGRSVPAGHALAFRDGNKANPDINNLELVHRRELMARNTVHRLPKDVALAVQMLGALRRQINHRNTREEHAA